ncbi:MAG: dual specificity protein phosphatase family protein [archaeon]|nr:dual specificity protein phosphatase family protein [archaeon]
MKRYSLSKETTSDEKMKCPICQTEIFKKNFPGHKEIHPTEILDWLFLGSYFNATNKTELKALKIKYILNCASECKNVYQEDFTYLKLDLQDKNDFPIENYFNEGITFLKNINEKNNKKETPLEEKGNVLVHCQLGKSRSAAIVMAYLMKENNLTTNEAYTLLKKKRRNILPNLGFMNKLRELEKELAPSNGTQG